MQVGAVVDRVAVDLVGDDEAVAVVHRQRPEAGGGGRRELAGGDVHDVPLGAGQRLAGAVEQGERVDRLLGAQRAEADLGDHGTEPVVGAVGAGRRDQVAVVLGEDLAVHGLDVAQHRRATAGDGVPHAGEGVGLRRRRGSPVLPREPAERDDAQAVLDPVHGGLVLQVAVVGVGALDDPEPVVRRDDPRDVLGQRHIRVVGADHRVVAGLGALDRPAARPPSGRRAW
ncbi:hypothetical protein GCM10022237_10370 [Nocardioides ginsengisoli]